MTSLDLLQKKTSIPSCSTAKLVKISLLSAISFLLYFFEIGLPIFPSFLKLDMSDLPSLVGAISMGPTAGIAIALVKNLLHLLKTNTAGIGELANFIVCISFILPISFAYGTSKTGIRFFCGAWIGILLMTAAACLLNYYILIPAYAAAFGADIQSFVQIAGKINSAVIDYKTLIFFAIAPFNLLKGCFVAVIGYFVCLKLKKTHLF